MFDYTKKDKGKALKKKNKNQPRIDSFFQSKHKKTNQQEEHQPPEPKPVPSQEFQNNVVKTLQTTHDSSSLYGDQQHVEKSNDFCDDVILCKCEIPAAVNRVSSTEKHIENRGRPYYWCQNKAVKPVGVDADKLNARDLAKYKDKCEFFLWCD